MITYGGYKAIELLEYADYSLQIASEEGYFLANDAFSPVNGFMIAAAVTSYDGSTESIEDEEIGTLKFYQKAWNVERNEGLSFKELKTRPCQTIDF